MQSLQSLINVPMCYSHARHGIECPISVLLSYKAWDRVPNLPLEVYNFYVSLLQSQPKFIGS